jgi:hypothetical protein
MLQTAQHSDVFAQLSNPDPVSKKVWRKKKAHGPAGLTSAKIAHRDLLAKKRLKGPHTEQPITRPSLPMTKDPGLYSAPQAGGIWQHEEDAWKDPGLCGVIHGRRK